MALDEDIDAVALVNHGGDPPESSCAGIRHREPDDRFGQWGLHGHDSWWSAGPQQSLNRSTTFGA
jgi:hypothetical protein